MSGGLKWVFGGAAACLFFVGLWLIGWQHTARLERELADAKKTVEELHIDHRDTMDAINRALDTRAAIHEQARLQEQKLARALKNDPLADAPISDDLRMRLQWDENGDCQVPAAGRAAGANSDSRPQRGQNGG